MDIGEKLISTLEKSECQILCIRPGFSTIILGARVVFTTLAWSAKLRESPGQQEHRLPLALLI